MKELIKIVIKWFTFSSKGKNDKSAVRLPNLASNITGEVTNEKLFSQSETTKQGKALEWYRLHI